MLLFFKKKKDQYHSSYQLATITFNIYDKSILMYVNCSSLSLNNIINYTEKQKKAPGYTEMVQKDSRYTAYSYLSDRVTGYF